MNVRSLLPSLWDRSDEDTDPFDSLHREIDRVFRDFGRTTPWFAGEARGRMLAPRIDVLETDKALEISAELPGVAEKDIDVSLSGRVLTIKGEKKTEKEDKNGDYHLIERSQGAFMRTMTLPFEVEASNIEAGFRDGVLTLKLPKPPEVTAKTQKVAIKTAA